MDTRKKLFHIMASLAGSAAMGCAYKGWGADFALKENNEIWLDQPASFRKPIGWKFTAKDVLALPDNELRNLGFRQWDEAGVWLIPIWVWNYIADGEELTCIDGSKTTDKHSVDLDVRGGCVAYGFSRPIPYHTTAEADAALKLAEPDQ